MVPVLLGIDIMAFRYEKRYMLKNLLWTSTFFGAFAIFISSTRFENMIINLNNTILIL